MRSFRLIVGVTLPIGFLQDRLKLHGPRSLKEKLRLILPLKLKLQGLFSVACAEMPELNHLQLAVLGFSCVSNSDIQARKMLGQIVRYLNSSKSQFEVVDHYLEVIVF